MDTADFADQQKLIFISSERTLGTILLEDLWMIETDIEKDSRKYMHSS